MYVKSVYVKLACAGEMLGRVLHRTTNTVHRPVTVVAKTQKQLYLTSNKILYMI